MRLANPMRKEFLKPQMTMVQVTITEAVWKKTMRILQDTIGELSESMVMEQSE